MNRRELLRAALGGMLAAAVPAGRALTGESDPAAYLPEDPRRTRLSRSVMGWSARGRPIVVETGRWVLVLHPEQSNEAIGL